MSRSRRRPTQKRQSADRVAARRFWGETWPDDPPLVHLSEDPSAMLLSLGEPPLRNSSTAAQAAFVLVARRAAQLAMLAATAAGLDDDGREQH